jgi:hypothetical protein
MSRARGLDLQNALARYLRGWWPDAESAGAGRPGTDVLATPGVAWECKTASDFKRDFKPAGWVRQSLGHKAGMDRAGNLPDVHVVIYWPKGIGEARADHTLSILPTWMLLALLHEARYAPQRPRTEEASAGS